MSCQKIMCDHPPIISHGTVTQGEEWTYGAEAIYSCDKGYTLTGQETIHCMDSGAWSHPPPNCTVQCERPRNLNNAIIYPDQHIYYYEDHVTFSCHPGYILMGSIESVCVGRDTFDPPPPTCKKDQMAQNHDLNIIGAVWHYLEKQKRARQPKSAAEL
ncbi:membrane cofactor protein-like [Hypanus sabinus]|uniref:membrane cofactor protein-like n=1 Tax=Hypanus sabinus TaxID=79690 RepID=UPI0028C3E4ED|nr:membrane cofactor protein-like [Hypanus sabinus]